MINHVLSLWCKSSVICWQYLKNLFFPPLEDSFSDEDDIKGNKIGYIPSAEKNKVLWNMFLLFHFVKMP